MRRIDPLFELERVLNGKSAAERLALRRELRAPLASELEAWMREQRSSLSRHDDAAKAMDYMLKRSPAFTRFMDDGRVCPTNNAAERALRGIALGRKSWLFVGSDRGGQRAAFMYFLIVTAKLNDVDPAGMARRCACPHRRAPESSARTPRAMCTALLRISPSSRTLTLRASKKNNG